MHELDLAEGWRPRSRVPWLIIQMLIPTVILTLLLGAWLYRGWTPALTGALVAVLVFLILLWLREHRAVFQGYRFFPNRGGAIVRDDAVRLLREYGFDLVEDEKSLWFSAVVYRLRFAGERGRFKVEIWSHGNRSRVILDLAEVFVAGDGPRICRAFDGVGAIRPPVRDARAEPAPPRP